MLDELETHVLLVLADGDLHGYAIAKEMERRGGPAIYPANLYRRLNALAAEGLIEALPPRLDESGRARKAFRLTAAGVEAVREQGARLRALVDAIETRDLVRQESGPE
jgi:PadR family transcriptional regulator PadR